MPVRVLKFGGTSVETPGHILAVARRILDLRESGDPIVVVVSAMGQTTDELIRLAQRVSRTPSRRELDMLLTAGERISMTLLAMCLESLGCPAISFTGSQSGIVTDTRHSDARILSVRAHRIEEELARGRVVIVAGFQGVSREKEVTTLGRGGSDTTAVALAIRLGAAQCDIYTDVPGVLSADPRIVPKARKLARLGYDPMVVLSHLGGRVLFRRAVLLARKYGLPLEVRSALTPEDGTRIPGAHAGTPVRNQHATRRRREETPMESEEAMETDRILAVALESPVHWVRVTLPAGGPTVRTHEPDPAPDLPDAGSPLLLHLSHVRLPDGSSFFELVASAGPEVEPWLEPTRWGRGASVVVERHAALVSLVGEAVLSRGSWLRRAAESMKRAGIPVWGMHTGTLSLSLLLSEADGEEAARVLHHDCIEREADPAGPR
jgi:aspartokinase